MPFLNRQLSVFQKCYTKMQHMVQLKMLIYPDLELPEKLVHQKK